MRLFVAFTLSEGERRRLGEEISVLRAHRLPVRWVAPELYHVTVKFLGEVAGERVEGIEERLQGVGRETCPMALTLSGLGAFPSIRRPKVLWLGVEASPELRALKQDVEWALGEQGFERDERAFHPHVTLGRVRRGSGAGAFRGLDEVVAELDFEIEVKVSTLDLVQSRLSADGPRHSLVSRSPLGGAT